MKQLFYIGFVLFVASTILFIVSILTRYWIQRDTLTRGIFEVCQQVDPNNVNSLSCRYILTYSNDTLVLATRFDYAIACSSLSVIASSLGIIFTWIAGIYMCVKGSLGQKVVVSLMIAGTLLIDCITVVIWVVMLAKNLDSNNVITRNEIGWSLWMAVGSTGGYLIALVLFCMHRIDLGATPYQKRQDDVAESREYLQRF